jgi:hypothetical protein
MPTRKFLPDNTVVQQRISEHMDMTLEHFSELLGSAPYFVTYYNRIIEDSTQSKGLDAVYSVIGKDSPIRYQRVENFPIYKMAAFEINPSEGEFGFESEMELDCIVLPSTIKPFPDDIIVIPNPTLEGNSIFEVIESIPSVVGSKRFYKLRISRIEKTLEEIELQKEQEARFNVRDFETGKRAVLLLSDAELLDQSRILREKFIKEYSLYFYDDRISNFVYQNNDGKNLIHFGINMLFELTNALSQDRPFYDTKAFLNYLSKGRYENLYARFQYIFYNLVYNINEKDLVISESFVLNPIDNDNTVFMSFKDRFYTCWDNGAGTPPDTSIFYSEEGFLNRIKNNEIYTIGAEQNIDLIQYRLENIIIKYINNAERSELINLISALKVDKTLKSFLLIPFIIVILKRIEDALTAKI